MKSLNLPKIKTMKGPAMPYKRILAFMIDFMILNFTVLFPFKSLFEGMVPEDLGFSESLDIMSSTDMSGLIMSVTFFASILMILYFTILEKKLGQSIGKILLNIRVESELKEKKLWQYLVRNLFLIPLFPFILLWILDPLFMLFSKDKKRLSEVLSKTKVVETYNY